MLRLLGPQGIAGLAVSACLALLLILQRAETSRWKAESARQEQLYVEQKAALATTVANVEAATSAARAADWQAAQRVATEQRAITERTLNEYEIRLAAARARADQLRLQSAGSAADSGRGGTSAVPRLSAPAASADQTPGKGGLPATDALTATEQAIQLDELIKWVRAQVEVDNNPQL